MGVVYEGHQRSPDRPVAIKILNPELLTHEESRHRFETEANAQAALRHPNVLPIFEQFVDGDLAYLVMPLITGGSLRDMLNLEPRRSIDWVLSCLAQLAGALGHAHGRGVVHRDVKPENVLYDSDNHAFLLADFGIAKILWSEGQTRGAKTTTGIGSPCYVAPEQIGSGNRIDGRSDQYSFGLLAWELIVGRPAFGGGNAVVSINQQLRETPPDPVSLRPECPPELARLIRRTLYKDPASRYGSMSELAEELEQLRSNRTRTSWSLRKLSKRSRALAACSLICAVGIAIWASQAVTGDGADRPKPKPQPQITYSDQEKFERSESGGSPKSVDADHPTDAPDPSRAGVDAGVETVPTNERVSRPKPASHPGTQGTTQQDGSGGSSKPPKRGEVPAYYKEMLEELHRQTPGYPSSTDSGGSTNSPEEDTSDSVPDLRSEVVSLLNEFQTRWWMNDCNGAIELDEFTRDLVRSRLADMSDVRFESSCSNCRVRGDQAVVMACGTSIRLGTARRVLVTVSLARDGRRWRILDLAAHESNR